MNRRGFCQGLAAGTAGLAAFGTASTAAAAEAVPGIVSTRGPFDIAWGDECLADGVGEAEYDVEGTVPGYEDASPDELVVMVHGYNQSPTEARGSRYGASRVRRSLARQTAGLK